MTPEEIKEAKKRHKARQKEYYSFITDIRSMSWALKDIGGRRETNAYKQLLLALDSYEQQIKDDFCRYEKITGNRDQSHEMKQLQQSLNRERALREGLENKIKEASESSGLFISYVRNKLKI